MFATGIMTKNRKIKNISDGTTHVQKLNLQRGFKITYMNADRYFEPLHKEIDRIQDSLHKKSSV